MPLHLNADAEDLFLQQYISTHPTNGEKLISPSKEISPTVTPPPIETEISPPTVTTPTVISPHATDTTFSTSTSASPNPIATHHCHYHLSRA